MVRIVATLLSGLLFATFNSTVVRADNLSTQGTHNAIPKVSYSFSVAPRPKTPDTLIGETPFAPSDDFSRLGAPPQHDTASIMKLMPKVGPFAVTFYSDVPATGFDGMYNADVVVSLTRKF